MHPAPVFFLAFLTLFTACTTPQKPLPCLELNRQEMRLIELMQERLVLARDVAWFKYATESPIYDPKREKQLLESLVREGNLLAVPPDSVRSFFQAQMAASRAAQTEWISRWKAGQPLPKGPTPDLTTNVRPRLDRISREMLTILAAPQFSTSSNLPDASKTYLKKAGFSPQVAQLASSGFLH